MKAYSNQPRKPMMYGGAAMKPKKKMSNGGQAISDADKKAMDRASANAGVQSRAATGRMSDKDKALMQQQTLEEMMRKGAKELQAIASDKEESAMRRQMAKRALTEKGGAAGAAAFPSGDQDG